MSKPTGKLAYAYTSLMRMEAKIKELEQENTLLTSKLSGYQKFMATYICYTPDELAEEERRRILKVAYELIRAFPHHTGVYHWMIRYADELLQNKQAEG